MTADTSPKQTQEPDTAPGPYYISARDSDRTGLVSGPYATHSAALDNVPKATLLLHRHDVWSAFYSIGTVRLPPETKTAGFLQKWYDLNLDPL